MLDLAATTSLYRYIHSVYCESTARIQALEAFSFNSSDVASVHCLFIQHSKL